MQPTWRRSTSCASNMSLRLTPAMPEPGSPSSPTTACRCLPNAPANIGKEAIDAWSQGFLGHFRVQFALDVDEVRILDDWAFERGGYSIALDPKAGGDSMTESGKYITLYKREPAGTWRMARDIWNSSEKPLEGRSLKASALK